MTIFHFFGWTKPLSALYVIYNSNSLQMLVSGVPGGRLCWRCPLFWRVVFQWWQATQKPWGWQHQQQYRESKGTEEHAHKTTLNSCLSLLFEADCHSLLIRHKSMSAQENPSHFCPSKLFCLFSYLNVIGHFPIPICLLLSSLPVFKD